MAIIDEIRRLRAEGWPPIAEIEGPQRIRADLYRVAFLDQRGEPVGDPIDIPARNDLEAVSLVDIARKQLRL